jgi:hypothetical protein
MTKTEAVKILRTYIRHTGQHVTPSMAKLARAALATMRRKH